MFMKFPSTGETLATAKVAFLALIISVSIAAPAAGQLIDPTDYWLMPHGLVANFENELWSGQTVNGEHCFWRGTRWGRTVALQGAPSMTRYDIFVESGSKLDYWGTFRGTGISDPESHTFDSPFHWMNDLMFVGQIKANTFKVRALDSELRRELVNGTVTMRLEINQRFRMWTLPETGVAYFDVLKITFFSDASNPNSAEVYHLAKGLGTIRFESFNSGEPSGVRLAWATSFVNKTISNPTYPWFDPFYTSGGRKTAVLNGFMEDLVSPVDGGSVTTYLKSWSGLSNDAVVTTDGTVPGNSGTWKIALKGSAGGGDGNADAASSDWIPVEGGGTYRLSGWIRRGSGSDNVYLDFNDGIAIGTNFNDVQAMSTGIHTWQLKTATVTVPSGTQEIKVRCVRDGSNQGNALFDGILLERID